MRNVIFSKDTEKLYNIRNKLLETLEPVDINIPIGEISQEFLVRLNEAVGIAITADSTDPKMKLSLQEFMSVNYSSLSVPSGRIPCKPKRSNSLTILTFLTYWSTKSRGSMKSR